MVEIGTADDPDADGPAPRSWHLRPARAGDEAAILRLVRELAAYEREPDAVETTEADLQAALFGPTAAAECLLAEGHEPGRPVVGMALWFPTFSTWTGRGGIWLEDLVVTAAYRRRGIARALLGELAATCVRRGWARLEWDVLDWNTDAIACYQAVGAVGMPEWVRQRVSGAALAGLAAHGGLAGSPTDVADVTSGRRGSEQP